MNSYDDRLPPMPPDMQAEWLLIKAEGEVAQEQTEARQYQAARTRGLSPQEARAEVERHRNRNDMLRAGFDAATEDMLAEATGTTTPPESTPRPRNVPSRDETNTPGGWGEPARQRPAGRRDRMPHVVMPAMPGRFSRALSSGGSWLRALALSLAIGGAVFLGVTAGLRWLFDTDTFLTWPTGIVAGWIGFAAFVGVLHAASREVREWIRLGGAKPIQRR